MYMLQKKLARTETQEKIAQNQIVRYMSHLYSQVRGNTILKTGGYLSRPPIQMSSMNGLGGIKFVVGSDDTAQNRSQWVYQRVWAARHETQ